MTGVVSYCYDLLFRDAGEGVSRNGYGSAEVAAAPGYRNHADGVQRNVGNEGYGVVGFGG